MIREHDIEGLIRRLTALGSNPHAYADETIRSRCDEATIVLSSLAAENGRMRDVEKAARALADCTTLRGIRETIGSLRAALSSSSPKGKSFTFSENSCPGHVASADNPKVCDRCGTHIDSRRPFRRW